MTDNEIIRALECCSNRTDRYCPNCPYYNVLYEDDKTCSEVLMSDALDLITRQQAEIKRLKNENKSVRYCYEQAKSYNDTLAESCEKNCKHFNMTTRAEAIKEFAERLKRESLIDRVYNILQESEIDKLVKEMTEVETN